MGMIPEVYEREYLRPFCEWLASMLGGTVESVEYDPETETAKARMSLTCLQPLDHVFLDLGENFPENREPG